MVVRGFLLQQRLVKKLETSSAMRFQTFHRLCCTLRKLQILQLFVASGMTMLIISCIFVARAYQILVDNMCLVTTRDSVSDQATET